MSDPIIIVLNETKHASFLAARQKDCISKIHFKAGDRVVVSVVGKTVFHLETWNIFLNGSYRGKTKTLKQLPTKSTLFIGVDKNKRKRFRWIKSKVKKSQRKIKWHK